MPKTATAILASTFLARLTRPNRNWSRGSAQGTWGLEFSAREEPFLGPAPLGNAELMHFVTCRSYWRGVVLVDLIKRIKGDETRVEKHW
jgi:hypothetical protein